MEVTRIFDILALHQDYNLTEAVCGKINGDWTKFSSKQFIENANLVSYALMALGINKNDKIAQISPNCPEWNFVDMGILQTGAIHIPVYPNISEAEYEYILNHSEASYVFVFNETIYTKIKHIIPKTPGIKGVFTFEKIEGVKHFNEFLELGRTHTDPDKLANLMSSVDPDDIATIIYTSGTTGVPKGAMLSHQNILSNVRSTAPLHYQTVGSRALSFLPLCHIYERMLNYGYILKGCSVYYVSNMGTIVDCMQEIKPHCFSTVPRLLEKVYDRIIYKGRNLDPIRKAIFFWAVNLGFKFNLYYENGWWYHFKLKIADILIFKKWRAAFGGHIFVIISGGAALQERLARVFYAAKLRVLEGYGLTETSPVIAVNNFEPDSVCFSTVGPVLEGTEVRIAADGEILAKGPHIMKGYFKDEEMTREVIDADGWFHTGDLGCMYRDRFLKITGRKKSLFKTSMGKYVSPEIIENKLRESRFIEQAIVLGENQKFVGALVVPDFQYLENWAEMKGFDYIDNITACQTPRIKKRIQREIDEYNKLFAPHEQIIKFELIPEEWTLETGELTPTLKIKRGFIETKYKGYVEKIFR